MSCAGCKQVFHPSAKLSRSSADPYSNSCMCDLSQVLSYSNHLAILPGVANGADVVPDLGSGINDCFTPMIGLLS